MRSDAERNEIAEFVFDDREKVVFWEGTHPEIPYSGWFADVSFVSEDTGREETSTFRMGREKPFLPERAREDQWKMRSLLADLFNETFNGWMWDRVSGPHCSMYLVHKMMREYIIAHRNKLINPTGLLLNYGLSEEEAGVIYATSFSGPEEKRSGLMYVETVDGEAFIYSRSTGVETSPIRMWDAEKGSVGRAGRTPPCVKDCYRKWAKEDDWADFEQVGRRVLGDDGWEACVAEGMLVR